jgi:hypothetical protein
MNSCEAVTYPIATIKSALMVCVNVNQPVMLWGPPGCAKSSIVRQIAEMLGWALFDVRCSDKEPPDLAGLPVADRVNKCVEWLQSSNIIPFERFDSKGKLIKPRWKNLRGEWTDKCLMFLDELDRAMQEVLNVALQLILDRMCNGAHLYDCVRVIAAGNGESDIGTTPFTEALSTRLTHLYVAHQSEEAVDGYIQWAQNNNVPAWAQAFAKYQKDEVFGEPVSFAEHARCNSRTFTWASKLIESCYEIGTKWSTNPKVVEACIFGTVGRNVGNSMKEFRTRMSDCPQPDEIFKDPKGCKLPKEPGLYYATSISMVQDAAPQDEKGMFIEDRAKTRAFCDYAGRWPEEYQANFFRMAKDRMTVASHQAYKDLQVKNL